MRKYLLFAVVLLSIALCQLPTFSFGQGMGISTSSITPVASAILELRDTTRGLLVPRMTTAHRNAIVSPANSLLIYNTTTNQYNYYNGASWSIISPASDLWSLKGNTGINPVNDFIGTSDAQDLVFRTNNLERMRITSAGLVGIGLSAPTGGSKFEVESTTSIAIFGHEIGTNPSNIGVYGDALGSGGGTNIGVYGSGTATTVNDTSYGVFGYADVLAGGTGTGTAGYIDAFNPTSVVGITGGATKRNGSTSGDFYGGYFWADTLGTGPLNATGIGMYCDAVGFGTNWAGYFGNGNVFIQDNLAIGDATPAAKLSVGAISEFQVNATGNITRINDVITSFPALQGAASTLLQNDGAGNLSWQAPPSGANAWTRVAPNIYPTTLSDNVGVGKSSPLQKLDVQGSINIMPDSSYRINNNRILAVTGTGNLFAGENSGISNTSGGGNTFIGDSAGLSNTTAYDNTFMGNAAGRDNSTGISNTFIGNSAGQTNVTGSDNTFIGAAAGYVNTGSGNSFIGSFAAFSNTSGANNTAMGTYALYSNITSNNNTAFGFQAGYSNTAVGNTFLGINAGNQNTSGTSNTYIGNNAGQANITNSDVTHVGYQAGTWATGGGNTTLGSNAGGVNLNTGANNTFIGYNADLATAIQRSKSAAIGYNAKVNCDNCLTLGGTGVDAVNVGIGTTTPGTTLAVSGDVSATTTSVVSAGTISTGVFSVVEITGTTLINTINTGYDGKILYLYNNTGPGSGVAVLGIAGNILTCNGGSLLTAGANNGWAATLVYDSSIAKWVVVSFNP